MFYVYFTLCASAHEGDSQADIGGQESPGDVPTPADEHVTQEVPARKRCCRCTPAKKENADELPPDYEDPFGFKSCAMIPMEQFEYIKWRAAEIMEKWGSVTRSELRARGNITCDDDSFLKGEIPDDHQEFFWQYTFHRGKEDCENPVLTEKTTGETKLRIENGANQLYGHFPGDPAEYRVHFHSSGVLRSFAIDTADEPRVTISIKCDAEGKPERASSVTLEEKHRRFNEMWVKWMRNLLSEPCPECHTKGLVIEDPGPDHLPYFICSMCGGKSYLDFKRMRITSEQEEE